LTINVVAIGVNGGPATAETTSAPPTTGGYPSAPGSVGSHLPTTGVHPPAIDSVGGGSSTAGGYPPVIGIGSLPTAPSYLDLVR